MSVRGHLVEMDNAVHRRRHHEFLCAWQDTFPPLNCYGCLLVELRSDAAYSSSEEERERAKTRLRELRDSADAHLADVLHGEPDSAAEEAAMVAKFEESRSDRGRSCDAL